MSSQAPSVKPTTHTPPITTTPSPTVPPTPTAYQWFVRENGTNKTCILLKAGIRMAFVYHLAKDPKALSGRISKDVPANGTYSSHDSSIANGTCGEDVQVISLWFFNSWSLSFTFAMNKSTYDLASVELNYTIDNDTFPDAVVGTRQSMSLEVDMFKTPEKKKYQCVAAKKIFGNDSLVDAIVELDTYSLTFEAFRNSTSMAFEGNAQVCEEDTVSQLVPIIVGAALGGLILVVLVAYLIGRKRSRRGYESV